LPQPPAGDRPTSARLRLAPDGSTSDYEFEDSQFYVRMFKHEFDPKAPWKRSEDLADMAVVLKSEHWGEADTKLGETLMSDFLLTLAERREKPRFVYLIHSAVKLAAASGSALESLKRMEALGVRILLNRTSLAHYKLEREVRVGEVTTMMDIVTGLCKVAKVLTL
jgi:hypothetical protein